MRLLLFAAATAVAVVPATWPARPTPARLAPTPAALDSARHLLSRLAFGPTPEQVEAVARIGSLVWVDRQLELGPGSDRTLARRETSFTLLATPTETLAREFRDLRAARLRAAERRRTGEPPAMPREDGDGREFRALVGQLPAIAIVRATLAEHQVLEVMADFWTNHFNVFYGKNLDRVFLPEYLEEVIRKHALGRFDELLLATARSPAMLVYLDNAQSVAPGSEPPGLARLRAMARGGRRAPARRARADSMVERLRARIPTGLNENYARELLELHTLGVGGGYTQEDVEGVARILTGWSIRVGVGRGGVPGGFVFNDWAHDRSAKLVLGKAFPAGGGEDEGRALLAMLARHPATVHHLSAKLCARLVADQPPDGCVDDAARAWRRSDGEIREVVRAIVRSPDFWAPEAVASKVKTPLEFVVGAVRAVGGDPDSSGALAAAVARLGQPLYLQPVPTGYPEAQEDWVSSSALMARMSFAVGLAAGRVPGVRVALDRVAPATAEPDALIELIDRVVLGGRMTPNTRAVIRREIARITDPTAARALAVGLAIGGPEFQRQ